MKKDPYEIYKKKEIKTYYSNCLIEAIKAKLKNPKNVKIIVITPKQNDAKRFHFMWKKDNYIYDFHIEWNISLIHSMWYKGFIRKMPYRSFIRLINNKCQ